MIIDINNHIVSTTEEVVDIHISFSPSDDEESRFAALIVTIADTVKRLALVDGKLNGQHTA